MLPALYESKDPLLKRRVLFNLFVLDDSGIRIPEEYKHMLKDAYTPANVTIPNGYGINPDYVDYINSIRWNALSRKYFSAIKLLKEMQEKNGTVTIDSFVTLPLLIKAYYKQCERRKQFTNIIKNSNWEEFEQFFSERCSRLQSTSVLSLVEEYSYKLYNHYVNIRDGKIISEVGSLHSKDVFEAIDNNDFFKALELCKDYLNEHQFATDDNALYLLLVKICEEIAKRLMIDKQNDRTAKKAINSFLRLIDMSQYGFVIENLINVGIQDNSMDKASSALSRIVEGEPLNIDDMVLEFKKAIGKKQLLAARSYLNIISRLKDMGALYDGIPALNLALSKLEQESPEQALAINVRDSLEKNGGAVLIETDSSINIESLLSMAKALRLKAIQSTREPGLIVFVRKANRTNASQLEALKRSDDISNLLEYLNRSGSIDFEVCKKIGLQYYSDGEYASALEYLRISSLSAPSPDKRVNTLIAFLDSSLARESDLRPAVLKRETQQQLQ